MSRRPLYSRLLHLRHVHPNGWQRAVLGEGSLALAAVLVLADLATAWSLVVLPVAVAVLVKLHDVLAGVLQGRAASPRSAAAPAAAEHDTSTPTHQSTEPERTATRR